MRTIVTKLLLLLVCCPLFAQQQINEDKVRNLVSDLAAKSSVVGVQQESYTYAADTGGANAYAVTLSPAPTIVAGSTVVFKAANANTGASTLAVNGGTATAIKKSGSTTLVSGDIVAGQIVAVVYDGTNWQMVGGSGSGGGCGSNNIPCTNTANTYTTGTQAISTGAPGTVGFTVKATNGGIATPAYVQGAANAPGNSTTIAMTFSSNVTAGNAIIVVVQTGAGGITPPTGISDTLGNTWTLIQSNTGAGLRYVVYGSYGVLGGPDTITLTGMSAGAYSSGVASEYSGVASASAVDVQTSFVGTSASPLTVGPITTNQSDLIFSVDMIGCCNATFSASGYTARGYIFNAGTGFAVQVVDKNAAAGSQSITWTTNSAGQPSAVALIALKAASTTPQTADLQEWKDASGNVLAKIGAAGGPTFPSLTLSSTTAVSCSSGNAGQFQYIQGNSSTKDIVQVCAHDASNVYAWRSIY